MLLRSKRAVSPIVTTLFLMAIIMGAIGFSLVIIYPTMQNMNDQLDLEGNASNFLILDENLRSLMLSGQSGSVYQSMDIGDTGVIFGDWFSTTTIYLKYKTYDDTGGVIENVVLPTFPSQYNETQHRLLIRQEIDDDFFPRNSNTYLKGGSRQNLFYLNETTKSSAPWTVLNQSRFNDNYVYTALSYRNVISLDKIIDLQTLTINITVVIQRVNFKFKDGIVQNGDTIQTVHAEYQGINVTTYPWHNIANGGIYDRVFYIQTITTLWDVGTITSNQSNKENPFYQEVPGNGQLNIRIQFIDHIVEFDLI